jgi:hypothetical protein
VTTLNPLAGGSSGVASQVALDSVIPWPCSGGGPGPATGGGSGCSQYVISGTWQVTQEGGYTPTFTFQQSGTTVTDTLTFSDADRARGGLSVNTYTVSGTVQGDHLDVIVTGPPSSGGRQVRT